jgi:hypothetical protein
MSLGTRVAKLENGQGEGRLHTIIVEADDTEEAAEARYLAKGHVIAKDDLAVFLKDAYGINEIGGCHVNS